MMEIDDLSWKFGGYLSRADAIGDSKSSRDWKIGRLEDWKMDLRVKATVTTSATKSESDELPSRGSDANIKGKRRAGKP